VDPNNLTKEFASILEEKVVATRVTVDLYLHSGLYVRSVPSGSPTEELAAAAAAAGSSSTNRPSYLSHHVGIATESMNVTFEYGIKKQKKKAGKAEKAEKAEKALTKEEKNEAKLAKKMAEKTEKDAKKAKEKQTKREAAAAKKAAKIKTKTRVAIVAPPPLPDAEDEQSVDGEAGLPLADDTKAEAAETSGTMAKETATPDRLPFQVQIRYTRTDKTPCIRVITALQQCTTDRDAAEDAANLDLLAAHSIQRGALMAMDGEYTNARLHAFENKKLMKRCAKSESKQAQYSWWKKVGREREGERESVCVCLKNRHTERGSE
jgi:hypothetical protein